MRKYINKLIHKLGKDNYSLDKDISSHSLFIIITNRVTALLRGYFFYRPFLYQTKGVLFVGKKCQLKHKHKIRLGKTVNIDDFVEINALSKKGVEIGNNVTIKKYTTIECTGVFSQIGEGLKIGNHVGISQSCFIQVRGFVEIGSHVILGPNVSIFSSNHIYDNTEVPIMTQGETRAGVVIEDDVWLGSGCIILDGIRVGKGSVVAAGSIVNKDVPPYSMVGGIPARLLKKRIE